MNQNSGFSNAGTEPDLTNYFFDVSNEAFEEAVDKSLIFLLSHFWSQMQLREK